MTRVPYQRAGRPMTRMALRHGFMPAPKCSSMPWRMWADAALAVTERYELAPEVAADGIDERLGRLAERPRQGDLPIESGGQVSFVATDVDASWTLLRPGDELTLTRISPDSGTAAKVVGSATGLFLALFRRLDAEEAGCRVEGDSDAWATFLARTPCTAPGTE